MHTRTPYLPTLFINLFFTAWDPETDFHGSSVKVGPVYGKITQGEALPLVFILIHKLVFNFVNTFG